MASTENEHIRQLWEGWVASLGPKPDGTAPGLDDFRSSLSELCAKIDVPAGATFEDVQIGGVPAISVVAGQQERTIVYLHGGGYSMGCAGDSRSIGAVLAAAASARVLLLDYRLAPEHPFPAGIDDIVAAYRALLDEGTDPGSIAICGESAGGGLALAALQAIRDAELPRPSSGVVFSPFADLALTGASLTDRAGRDPVIAQPVLEMLVPMYLGATDPKTAPASPAHGDFTGLPPLQVFVGTEEALWDDAHLVVERARAAGVDVSLHIGEGMFHVWPIFATILPEGRATAEQAAAFIVTNTQAAVGA